MPFTSPYVYPEVKAPLAGTITDILRTQGDPYARAAVATGQAQAQATELGGQAWAGAAQGIGQAIAQPLAQTAQRLTDPRAQLEKQAVEQNQATLAGQAAVNRIIAGLTTQNPDGSRVVDRGKLSAAMASQNVPLSVQSSAMKQLDDVDASIKTFQQAKIDHMADLAHGILTAPGGATADNVLMGAALAQANGLASGDQLAPIVTAATNGQDLTPLLTQLRGMSEKYKDLSKPVILPRPGAAAINPASGDIIATAPQAPEKPVSVAPGATLVQPSSGQVVYQAPAKPGPLEEQLLEAVTNGDRATADRITTTMQREANAKRDPAQAALALELRNLNVQTAQQRLDDLRKKNAPLDISGSVNTTMSGRHYIDVSEWQTPEDRQKAQQAAVAGGIVPVNKDTAGMLSDLDTARQNQQTMLQLVESKLPKDAAGRLLKGPANTIEQLAQMDPQLAAIGTFRNAAIQSMRAVAGAKGLRINQAEVQLAIDNDIPKLTDTLDTARQKLANLSAFMDNIEKAHLVRDRSALTGTSALPQPPAGALDPTIQMLLDRKP